MCFPEFKFRVNNGGVIALGFGQEGTRRQNQEKAQSEKDSRSKNRGGKKQTNNQVLKP